MGTWNHRVMRRSYAHGADVEVLDEIYEVYYDDDGSVNTWTENPVGPIFYVNEDDDQESIKDDVNRFLLACDKPILDYETGKKL
jgi:hypothetical protein